MARQLEEFVGRVTYNIVNIVSNGTKKMFNGYILLNDVNGKQNSYKVISFRTHVIFQAEKLGTNGIKNKMVKFKGYFKENTYNGQTTFQLMAEEMYIEGLENLAIQAENASTSDPNKPNVGSLPPAGATIKPAGNIQNNTTVAQMPMQNTVQQGLINATAPSEPQPIVQTIDTTIYPQQPTVVTPSVPVAPQQTQLQTQGPSKIEGGFVLN